MLIYTNGNWVAEKQAVVPFHDQGFLYGDSLFETIRVNQGQPFRLRKHLSRLRSGMQTIQLDDAPFDTIPFILNEFIKKNDLQDALVRVMITRGVSRDASSSAPVEPALYVSAREIREPAAWPVRVVYLEEKNYPILRFYPAIKSGNYLGNRMAIKDAEATGAYEPVFVNRDGYVTECAIRNIFFVKDHILLTPAVELGVLPGVMRDTIMELARKRSLRVEEALIKYKDVPEMDEAFISSSGVGVLPVTWDGFTSDYALTRSLRKDLKILFKTGASDVT